MGKATYGTSFNSLSALIMNCDATAANSKPMMRVVIFKAIGLSHFAPVAESLKMT